MSYLNLCQNYSSIENNEFPFGLNSSSEFFRTNSSIENNELPFGLNSSNEFFQTNSSIENNDLPFGLNSSNEFFQTNSSIENNELPFGLNSSCKNYEPQLSNELLLIKNSNALTGNINFDINNDNALQEVFINNQNIDLDNKDILGRPIIHIEIKNSEMNSNSNNHKLLGRKNKGSKSKGKHNEYSEDNMIRKFKIYIIKTCIIKINSELKKAPVFIEINGKKYKAKKLVKIDQQIAKNSTVNEIGNFLNNSLKTILSVDISEQYKSIPKNYNQLVIEKLYEENKTNVTCILEKSGKECIKYFRKDEDAFLNEENTCLNGIEKRYESLHEHLRNKGFKEDYIKKFIEIIKDFENINEKKSPRKARSTKVNNETKDVSY